MAKIGFIGLGIMGGPMAGHLIDAGHELHLYNLPAIPPALAARGQVRSSAKDVAEHAEIVIVMVPDTPDVRTVLFAKMAWLKAQPRQGSGRHELHLAGGDEGFRQAHSRPRL